MKIFLTKQELTKIVDDKAYKYILELEETDNEIAYKIIFKHANSLFKAFFTKDKATGAYNFDDYETKDDRYICRKAKKADIESMSIG